MIDVKVIEECRVNELRFSDVIKRLTKIKIERYYTDLVRMQKIYYSSNGKSHIENMVIDESSQLAHDFNQDKVIEALRLIQKDKINYSEFIKRIIAAGVASYTVYIDGKHVVYAGRKGETYIETFLF